MAGRDGSGGATFGATGAAAASRIDPPVSPRAGATSPRPCSWSYFGDPRALVHGRVALIGCVTRAGRTLLIRSDTITGAHSVTALFARMEGDDHMYVHYRESRDKYGLTGGFLRVRNVSLPKGCGVGYTAVWDGRWTSRLPTFAGGRYGGYLNGGASLDHADPSWLAVATNAGAYQDQHVQLLRTPDDGASWVATPVANLPGRSNYRPVFARGDGPPLLTWVAGQAPYFRNFRMRVVTARVAP